MKSLERMLVFVGTPQQTRAIRRAAALAFENDAKLTLIDVLPPLPRIRSLLSSREQIADLERSIVDDRRVEILELADKYVSPRVQLDVVVKIGDPVEEIVLDVIRNRHDLVIKTAAGLPHEGSPFGSLARSLLRICPCPVLVLKPAVHGDFDHVLAAIDLETDDETHCSLNRTILDTSMTIARSDNATLHLLSTWDDPMDGPLRRRAGDAAVDASHSRKETRIQLLSQELLDSQPIDGVDVQTHLERGTSAELIRRKVDELQADLLVMGTVCRTGIAGFLVGNTAEAVLARVNCSILALKPEGFVCPISDETSSARHVDTSETLEFS